MRTKEVEVDRESVKVFEWRREWLISGGWGKRNARLLAESDVDWRYANKLLKDCKKQGYNQEFAMELLLD